MRRAAAGRNAGDHQRPPLEFPTRNDDLDDEDTDCEYAAAVHTADVVACAWDRGER